MDGSHLPQHQRPTVRQCVETAGALCHVPTRFILSDARDREYILARDLACWLARDVLALSWSHVGRAIDRDHTSIIHAHRRAIARGKTDPRYREIMGRARAILEGKEPMTMEMKGPLMVSTGSQGIVSIIDVTGHVMTEVYPGQIYEPPPVNDKRCPTQAECESVARSLVEAYNHVHGFGAKPASAA